MGLRRQWQWVLAVIWGLFFLIASPDDSRAEIVRNGSQRYFSDSLVNNLDCKKLTPYNVLTFVRADAFKMERHIPLSNWYETFQPGHCWALAQAQRRIFYLARFNRETQTLYKMDDNYFLKLFGVAFEGIKEINIIFDSADGINVRGWRNLSFYQEPAGFFNAFLESTPYGFDLIKQILGEEQRRLQSQIENVNIPFENRRLDRDLNHMTYQFILSSLKMGRIPLLVIKINLFTYHVVLVKSESKGSLFLYDPNSPYLMKKMYYRYGQFFYPELNMGNSPFEPIDVFAKGEEDMNRIQQHLFKYYSKQCTKN